ncbi:GntR family transcriptional regulator [Actinoplanes nipponensis]|uniref:GntR family transcriptional regulator n=1 Tax=Actinoplanes nipponensis TaxID=135950 RepID=UPI0019437E66|nr:GntR family transcriptional regulator [Actinoplanes nipponensis]
MSRSRVTRTTSAAPLNGAPAAGALVIPVEQPASRSDRVYDSLRRAILDGTLPPGRPLVERELAESLGVSKTPVREALKKLALSGLVEMNSYSGVSVRRIDGSLIEELYTARAGVEPTAVRLAVVAYGPARHDAARQALDEAQRLATAGETAALGLANRRFHREIYSASGNRFLCEFLNQLQDLTTFVATAGWRLKATFEQEAEEHRAILAAMEAGDPALAERLAGEHIRRAARTLVSVLGEQPR